jgi:four helix bundle protein
MEDVDTYPKSRGADAVAGQILDSSISISANISEGWNRSQKRFGNCLHIALGEANETENWLYKVRDADFMPQ